MAENIKSKAFRGVVWTALERISSDFASFSIGIFLARLLTPSDYGTIGMLYVFLSISKTFIDCGFTHALIRRKTRTEEELSTAFWSNLSIAIVCYLLLFWGSPWIASFYNMKILCPLMRVLGLTLIVDALYAIQITRLTAEVNFKTQAKVTAVKILVGGVTGIAFAYNGFGPWSLVAYNMTSGITSIVLYYSITKWHPKLIFSKKAFSELFGFGVKLLAANLLHTVYTNISTLIIGRKYTSQDLGFYSRGDSFSGLPIGIYTSTFSRVIYPVLAKVQDDENELRRVYAKYLRLIAAIVVPSMLLFAGCMTPFIRVLIGDQWIPAAKFAMLLCFAQMFDPLTRVNSNILYVKGRSDILLKLEFIKKAIGISTVMIAVQFGVVWLCVGRVLYSIVAFVLNASFGGRFLGMSVFRQVKEVLPSYVIGGAVFALAYFVTSLVSNKYISILTGGFSGLVLFVVLICLFKLELWMEITQRTAWLFNRIRKRCV